MIYLGPYFFYDAALLSDRPTMVEIGVFTVEKADRFVAAHPGGRAILVEPDPANFATLARRASGTPHAIWNLALAKNDGPMPFHRYGHEQWHSTFNRHECEGMRLVETVTVNGTTLDSLLGQTCMRQCDLLLMNCEGAEIFALEQICNDAALRSDVPQICTSFHCDHIHIYPPEVRDDLLQRMGRYYDITVGTFKPIPYYLFRRKDLL